ncbi:MAG: L-dopachrome tautomerase-related protein [Pseudomonadota bacterium]
MAKRLIAGGVLALMLAGPALSAEVVRSFTQFDWTGGVADEVAQVAPVAAVQVAEDGTMFLSTPRWMNAAVPATLSRVTADGTLAPYPSAADHDINDPAAMQNVLGFSIVGNRIYAIDKGDVAGRAETPAEAQKIVVIDMDEGAVVNRIVIPHDVSNPAENFLNDLTVDEARGFAYVTDSGNASAPDNQTAIIVVNLETKETQRVLSAHDSTDNDTDVLLRVSGELVFPGQPLQVGINGIALSPDGETLYWSQTTGLDFYRMPTAVLRDPASTDADIEAAVEHLGTPGGSSDGIAAAPDGTVYVTDLTNGAIKALDPETLIWSTLVQDPRIVWPDTIDVSADGSTLHFTSNQLHRAFGGVLSFEEGAQNFEVWRVDLD